MFGSVLPPAAIKGHPSERYTTEPKKISKNVLFENKFDKPVFDIAILNPLKLFTHGLIALGLRSLRPAGRSASTAGHVAIGVAEILPHFIRQIF